ncbi:MAG: mechanosensitive ion channel domain-containing protein [Bacteroidota bacterium]
MNKIFVVIFCLITIKSDTLLAQSAYRLQEDVRVDQSRFSSQKIDDLGRDTPQGAVKGVLDAFARGDFDLAIRYFNFQKTFLPLKDENRKELAEAFFRFLTKGGQLTPRAVLSNDKEGLLQDGLASHLEQVGKIIWEEQTLPIFLERVKHDQEDFEIWLISAETIEGLQKLPLIKEESFKTLADRVIPEALQKNKWRGAPIGHWIGIVFLLVISYAGSWLICHVLVFLIKKHWKKYSSKKHAKLIKSFLLPIILVIAVTLFLVASRSSGLSIIVREAFSILNISVLWATFFLFGWILIDTFSSRGEENLRKRKNLAGLSVVLFFRRSTKFILIAVAGVIILDTFGADVNAGLAALGIGGLALALGAQKTIENLVGSLMVVFDQPVRVGDFCKIGETLGTIESIGMRSTRIKTLNRTVVTIPNGDFSSQSIENYSQREKFLFRTVLGLRFETRPKQMRYILTKLQELLYAHPKVETKPQPVAARVRFLGYGSDCLNVELFAYINVDNYDDFLAIQEDLNLRIADVIEDSGSGFAFPSQTIYLAKDSGLNQKKMASAEEVIAQQIKHNELQFPSLSEKRKEELFESLPYPPEGAVELKQKEAQQTSRSTQDHVSKKRKVS